MRKKEAIYFWTRGYQYVEHDASSLSTVVVYMRDQKRRAGLAAMARG